MSRRILVADDSSTIQKVIKIAFSRYSVEMVEAASYIEALSCLASVRPEALILDASLPGAQGPSDFAKLAGDSGGAPVLLLVGTYETIDEAQFRACGFHNFLRKPFDSNELVSQVDQMLGGSLAQGGAAQPARGETIPPGSTQRPAHATVFHAGGLGESQRNTRASKAPPPPPPIGMSPRATPSPVPPPPAGRKSAPQLRLGDDDQGGDALPPPPAPVRRSAPAIRLDDDDTGGRPAPPPPGAGRRGEGSLHLDDDDDGARSAAPAAPPGRMPAPPPPGAGRRSEGPLRLDDDESGDWAAPLPTAPGRMPPPPPPGRRVSGPSIGLDEDDHPSPPVPPSRASGRRQGVDPRPFASYGEGRGEEPSLDLRGPSRDDSEALGVEPPLATDERRKGRRAFSGGPFQLGDESEQREPPSPLPGGDSHYSSGLRQADAIPDELVRLLEAQLPALVREAVEAYCERHFKSLAREVIAAELRRLADDKARHLVDQ